MLDVWRLLAVFRRLWTFQITGLSFHCHRGRLFCARIRRHRSCLPSPQPYRLSCLTCGLALALNFFGGIRNCGTDPISLLILLFFFSLGVTSSKKPKALVSNKTGMKFGRIVLQANMHRSLESDFRYMTSYCQRGRHDVISRRKVLPFGECTRSICPAPMQQRPPVPDPQYIRTCSVTLLLTGFKNPNLSSVTVTVLGHCFDTEPFMQH